MYSIIETVENDTVCCTAVPRSWVTDNALLWPNSLSELLQKRKNCAKPESTWKTQDCTVLKDNIGEKAFKFFIVKKYFKYIFAADFKTALRHEEEYANYSDSDSAARVAKYKELKRKHPIKHVQLDLTNLIENSKSILFHSLYFLN